MSGNKRRIVVIGATSSIAEHCARLWVKETSTSLTLVGRDAQKMQAVAADLLVRNPQTLCDVRQTDFEDPAAIGRLADEIFAGGPVDIVLIAHGSLPDQGQCEQNLAACAEALKINGISPLLFAEAFVGHMEKANQGTLAIIGSVAGDQGRKSNYVYGAAKGMVTRYAQGLQHRLARSGVKIVLIKPGPTDTPMTAHLKQKGVRMASVEEVAQGIVAGIARGRATIYVPGKWRLIMTVIQHLPRFVFNRMDI
ncbi:MAG TPA: SDR family NAD(P)-dependent oxidoreductase [Burkholderiales bacterium]|jgi:hypothetical protein|nr:SDR family NAD(P)-dependent oxidoreductase [Burkholderiales bacterium]